MKVNLIYYKSGVERSRPADISWVTQQTQPLLSVKWKWSCLWYCIDWTNRAEMLHNLTQLYFHGYQLKGCLTPLLLKNHSQVVSICLVDSQHINSFSQGVFQSSFLMLQDEAHSRPLAWRRSLQRSMASTLSSSITDLWFLYLASSAPPRRPVHCLLFS